MTASVEESKGSHLDPLPGCTECGDQFSSCPGHCRASGYTVTQRLGQYVAAEDGTREPLQLDVGLQREAGEYRPASLRWDELHSVSIGIGLQGWDREPYITLGIDQVEELRDELTRLIELAQSDRAVIVEQLGGAR